MSWSRLSLRWRLTLIGTAVLSVGLVIGGVLLQAALAVTAEHTVDAEAIRTASDVADLITADQLPQPVPMAGQELVQVVDDQDRVRAGSPGVDRLVPLLDHAELARALSGERFEVSGARAGLNGPLRVLARPARSSGSASDQLSVIIAVPLSDDQGTMRALRTALLALFLPLVFGLAALAWWVIGRTLRPVETLRTGAEEITGRAGAGRLPVPAGGDEIHRLAVTLNDMLDRLEAGRRRQRQFVADAAHELRNPLAGMRTHLEVARRHPDRADWQELTDDLLTDTERLALLADDLLLLAGADEAGASGPPRSGAVPLDQALTRVAARYRDARVPVGLDLVHANGTAAGRLVARADPEDLHRVLTNLVDNAVRHAAGGVRLGAAPDRAQVLITVTDDGPGIPAADREIVFGRFTRLDDARAGDGGAGLGLAIVAELVRRHGGTITLTGAEPGPGLLVEIRLPAA